MQARERQARRFAGTGISCNARIPSAQLRQLCPMTDAADRMLGMAFEKLALSARAYDRVVKVARTIADLDGCDTIDTRHVAEAVQYRSLDRKYWGH